MKKLLTILPLVLLLTGCSNINYQYEYTCTNTQTKWLIRSSDIYKATEKAINLAESEKEKCLVWYVTMLTWQSVDFTK
jgi:PBP1b-binding outer membrane lipoprotein LpoB